MMVGGQAALGLQPALDAEGPASAEDSQAETAKTQTLRQPHAGRALWFSLPAPATLRPGAPLETSGCTAECQCLGPLGSHAPGVGQELSQAGEQALPWVVAGG